MIQQILSDFHGTRLNRQTLYIVYAVYTTFIIGPKNKLWHLIVLFFVF